MEVTPSCWLNSMPTNCNLSWKRMRAGMETFRSFNILKFPRFSFILLFPHFAFPSLSSFPVSKVLCQKTSHPPCNGGHAHYVMASKIQWKPFWLATQLYPQNDLTGWQNGVNDDVCRQAPCSSPPHRPAIARGQR